jgi:predicted adenylyl cyclase CyaB
MGRGSGLEPEYRHRVFMRNIELKVRVDELEGVCARLRAIGARADSVLVQTDTYFAVSHGRLKLREQWPGGAQLIAYHRPAESMVRVSEYVIASIEDPAAVKRVLAHSPGVLAIVRKRRELWLYRCTRIHLDEVEDLGYFVELETVIRDLPDELAQAEFEHVVSELALGELESFTGSYADLLLRRSA